MENYIFPISSADNIGASSYFLNLNQAKILFDCGARQNAAISFPNYSSLLGTYIQDFDEIDAIFISHAHFDHIGSIADIAEKAMNARIYTTKTTKELIRLQMITFDRNCRQQECEKLRRVKREMMERVMQRIIEVPVLRTQKEHGFQFTFYPAGHMAGAAMIMIQTDALSVLYTGDFSVQKIFGMNEPRFNGARPDILLMNATNGFKYKTKSKFDYKELERMINSALRKGKNVLLQSSSIPKHLDLFYAMKLMKFPVKAYLHESSLPIANAFAELGYQVYTDSLTGYLMPPREQHILISQYFDPSYENICVDYYSIHASFADLVNLVYQFMPKKVFTVHYSPIEHGLCFKDDLEIQGRFHGEIVLCKEAVRYDF